MAKRKTGRNGLTAAEIAKFRDMLIAKRNEILGNVTVMEDETFKKERSELSSMPFHMADAGSDNFEQEFALDLMDSEKKMLVEINDALRRIDEGLFGVCEGNGESIPKARLNAIPWARFCVACAELSEKGQLGEGKEKPTGLIPFGDDEDFDSEEEEEEKEKEESDAEPEAHAEEPDSESSRE
jgi:RNA polymerase-binding protein DksA